MGNILEHKNEKNQVVFKINKRTKKGKYYILVPGSRFDSQSNIVNNPISIEGFDKLPTGFYKDGFGLTTAGDIILKQIYYRYKKKIDLTVTSSRTIKFDSRGKTIKVILPQYDLSKLGQTMRSIKRERNEEMRLEAQHFLGTEFSQFKDLKNSEIGYVSGKLAEVLNADNIINKLNSEDRKAFEALIPNYLSNITGTLRAKNKLKIIYDALDAGKTIYLKKVLKEFRTKLNRRIQNEQIWQKFLSEYILIFQHNYGEVLEKESVSLQGKFPDFMLVDPYGYLDIYEIKKPSTSLMKLDNSRNNYYWDVEVSKAIAQVENYIYQAQRHADILANDIRRAKGIDVNIVKPRGFIIVGLRTQLTSEKMKDDFRIMSESLKNIDIILYDDLLESLEAFVSKI